MCCSGETHQGHSLSCCPGAQEGVGDDTEVLFVGCLPVEIEVGEQEVRTLAPSLAL